MIPLHQRIKNGRTYITSRKGAGNLLYLRCKNVAACFGTAKIHLDTLEIEEQHPHSAACTPDPNAIIVAEFKDAVKTEIQRQYYRLRDLYDLIALLYPEGAALVPFQSLRPSMKVWRRAIFPAKPRTLLDLSFQLSDPQNSILLQYHHGQFTSSIIRDANNDLHIGLYDHLFLLRVQYAITIFFVDSTYDTTPNIDGQIQLLTLMGVYQNHVIPLMWYLMSRKTQAAYRSVFANIREQLPEANFTLIGSDFEQAQRNELRSIFPDAFIVGCHFHYARAILGKIRSVGLTEFVRNNEEANLFVRKVLALAFLPENTINTAFEDLVRSLSRATYRRLNGFIVYYRNFWLGRVTPAGFSIFGLDNRTNNFIEAYHARLLHRLGLHPSSWDFICKLKSIQELNWIDVAQLDRGVHVQRQVQYRSLFRNEQLQRAWRLWYLHRISLQNLLTIGANLIGSAYLQKIDVITEERIQDILALENDFLNVIPNPVGVDPEFNFEVVAGYRPNERLILQKHLLRHEPIEGEGEMIQVQNDDEGAVVNPNEANGRRRRNRRRRRRRVAPPEDPIAPLAPAEDAAAEAEQVAQVEDPAPDAELIARAENVDVEAEAIVPPENPAVEAEVIVPAENPAVEAEVIVPAENPAVEAEVIVPAEAEVPEENPVVEAELTPRETCIVGLVAPREMAYCPCGHFTCCARCAVRIQNTTGICPTCRTESVLVVRIYM